MSVQPVMHEHCIKCAQLHGVASHLAGVCMHCKQTQMVPASSNDRQARQGRIVWLTVSRQLQVLDGEANFEYVL